MSVLTREALEASPLADLHQIAAELEISGYRRLRKADLIDRLLDGKDSPSAKPAARARGGRAAAERDGAERAPRRRQEAGESRRRERGGSDTGKAEGREPRRREGGSDSKPAPASVEGKLTVQSSGAGFVEPKDGGEQVYVSAAQIRRLELADGDVVGGPVRAARRSEKHPSLTRVESINGRSADEVAPPVPGRESGGKAPKATLPTERIVLAGDSTLVQIDKVAPIGRGSRVVLHGGPHSGKSVAARSIAAAMKAAGIEVFTALAGVREEEQSDWADFKPVATETIDSSPDSRAKAVERALDKARRAAGSGHAALVVDSVDELPGAAVRKTLAAAKATPGGGSLTVVVTARAPQGGETTVVGFDQALAAAGKFPSLKVRASSTLRPDLLVDARGLKALHKAHADAVKKER